MTVCAGRYRSRLAALALALAAVIAPAAAQAAAPAPPAVTISPLKGTPDASPTTQISFLGVPAADLSQIAVVGTRSGHHSGKLAAYATGTGASFVVARPFASGETVTVSALETVKGQHRSIGTTFTVGSLYAIPPPPPTPALPVAAPGTVASLASVPNIHPPTIAVTTPAADPALGDVFLTPVDGASQAGAMIVNPAGQMVWFSPAPPGSQATDLRVQQYLGHPVLTYWQGRVALGHGLGSGIIDDQSYHEIAHVNAGNGLAMDLHEFVLEPGGVALITVYEPVYMDLKPFGGASHGVIDDCVVQEIDVRTGLVMFEWHALGHVSPSASYSKPWPGSGVSVWDWFHINSIDVQPSRNLLISSRSTWAVYDVGHTYGEVLWTLGGRHSSFTLGPNVRFAWQHDATRLADGSIEIFDNEDTPKIGSRSRGIDVALNFATHAATLAHEYIDPGQVVLSPSQGDVQQLTNTDRLVGWGQIGIVSEFSAQGVLTFQLNLPAPVASYRAFRFPWSAQPATPPVLVASRAAGSATTAIAASWNGATGVLAWQVLAGSSASALAAVGTPVASSGFETALSAATSAPYVAVQALGAGGAVLATSAAVAVA
ncbi:MAG TPA: arylsulfotransferase family protein [Solirubrobacteraceae bacterium]|nr:arylsulfotransferase family protein [Solirubrobacteraceae bacterium]